MAGNRWSRVQEATGDLGEALMRIAMMSDQRRYRAEQLARQGRLDMMAQERINLDEQMLAQSVARTNELTRQGGFTRARASADIIRDQGELGLTPNLDGTTEAEFLTGLGEGVPQDWNYDPTQSRSYQARGATNQQALTQAQALADQQTAILGERATALGEQGLDITGRRLATPEPDMITMNGRKFPNTPEGQAAALEWREQVEAVGGGSNIYSDEVLELMGGGRPPDEGENWFGKTFGGLFGGRGGGGAPPATGMLPQALELQIRQLRDEGWTEEEIQEWLRTQDNR